METVEPIECGWGDYVGEPPRTLSTCHEPATRYGGGRFAGDWAAPACDRHAEGLAWSEPMIRKVVT